MSSVARIVFLPILKKPRQTTNQYFVPLPSLSRLICSFRIHFIPSFRVRHEKSFDRRRLNNIKQNGLDAISSHSIVYSILTDRVRDA